MTLREREIARGEGAHKKPLQPQHEELTLTRVGRSSAIASRMLLRSCVNSALTVMTVALCFFLWPSLRTTGSRKPDSIK